MKTHGTDAGPWVMPAMLVLGALGGALYAAHPGDCKVQFGASEILTSLMLVYVADLLLDYLVRGPWRDPNGYNFPTTAEFDPVATVPILIEGSRLHLGALIAAGRRGAGGDHARPHDQGIRNSRRRRRAARRRALPGSMPTS